MGADPITMALIATSVASQVGAAQASVEQQKQTKKFTQAKRNNDAAQSEQARQENLRRSLSAQRAGLAASGVDGTGQSAMAQTDALVSQTQVQAKQQNVNNISQAQGVDKSKLNQSIFTALGQANSLMSTGG